MPADRRPTVTGKRPHRSAVTNASKILVDVDGRTRAARRYRDVLEQLVEDMGGNPSEAQSIIARRAATLVVWAESVEADLASGEAQLNVAEYATAMNTLRRLLTDLGLERRARDVTPSLEQYLASRETVS